MGLQTPITTSFNGGELSPMMFGRTDTAIYAIGAEKMENMVPMIEGPMQKRPGFERIRAAAASSTWLSKFIFNNTQAYVIEGLEEKARFYTNGIRIETDPVTPYEVTVPFAAAQWPSVSMQQSYDRLYMAHGSHAPGALSRTGAATFAWAALALKNGPFKDGNSDEADTITVSGTLTVGGTVTVTCPNAIFQAGHVGGFFRMEAKDYSDIPAWEVGLDSIVSGSSKRRSDGKVYLAASNGRTGTVAPTHEDGTEWDGDSVGQDINAKGPYGVQWTYLYDRFGIIEIDTVAGDGLSCTGTVVRRIPDSLASVASWRWAHGAFSTAEGWPNIVFIQNSRLCFWKGFELYESVVGDYLNFQQFTSSGVLAADMAFRLVLASADPPLWAMVDRDLIVGTPSSESGEFAIGAVNTAAPVSADNIGARKQSAYGTAPVWPIAIGTSIIYVQRGGKQLREAQYDFGGDRYQSANINRWARHIAGAGLIQLGHQQQTEELLFAVREDGQLVFRSYDPEQEVKGFARCVMADGIDGNPGQILSAVCIPSEDGKLDEIWALIEWDGAKSVQRMAPWWEIGRDVADAFFVDDGLSDSLGVASDTISGLDHLIGAEVSILADGGVCPKQVVPGSGTITIPYAAFKRTVGRGYAARMKSLRPEVRDPSGQTSQGKKQRLINFIMRLLETSGMKASAVPDDPDRFNTVLDRPTSAAMDAPQPLFTGDTDGVSLMGEWARSGQYEILSDDPRPCFVVATMPRIEVSPS